MDYLFSLPPAAFIALAALLGLVVGSFLNVVIARLPVMAARAWQDECAELCGRLPGNAAFPGGPIREPLHGPFNLMVPRSHCPHCGHILSIAENIPLVSYLLLRGRCAACHESISLRYPVVELLGALLAGTVAWRLGMDIRTGPALIFTWALIALAFIDLEHQQLPDEITLPMLWLGLAINLSGIQASLADAVLGAILGYGILWGVYHIFRLLAGKEGMGHGDFKLLAMAGAWLGWQAVPGILFMASVTGATVGVALILFRGHDRNVPIPFGPYLAMAAWIALLWGDGPVPW